MKSVNKFCNSIRDASKDESVNSRGNTVYRMFADSERYIIDFADDFKSEGWEQFDTDQDASYFGVWINRRDCLTLVLDQHAFHPGIVQAVEDRQHMRARHPENVVDAQSFQIPDDQFADGNIHVLVIDSAR